MLALGFFIYKANNNLYIEDAKNSVESVLDLTQELISHEKQLALSVALMLSQNEAIKDAYRKNDRQTLFAVVQDEIQKTKRYLQMDHLEVQLHTKEGNAWVRSWDFQSYENDLVSWRKGIALLHQNQIPTVAIELGKRLNIKALAPIFDHQKFIGSLEVINGFDDIAQNLQRKKIHFAILMNSKFLDTASWMTSLEQINNYVVVHSSCTTSCYDKLHTVLSPSTLESGFARANGTLYGFTPLFDIESRQIGFIGVWFDESLLKESLLLRAVLAPYPQSAHIKPLLPSTQLPQEVQIR